MAYLKGWHASGFVAWTLTLIILIDNLKLSCSTHKYVDDTTLTEILLPGQTSQIV